MAIRYGPTPADDVPEVVEATEARSGSWGRHVLWVLIISTALAAMVLLGSWAFSVRGLEGPGGPQQVQVPAVATTVAPTPVQ